MPDQVFQRKTVDIQGQIRDQIGKYKKTSPLQRLPKPPAFPEETAENRSCSRQIDQRSRLSCQKYKEPVFCKKIQPESCHISGGENGIIAEILPIVQIQTVFYISVIPEDRCHQQQDRPKDYHS